jgi:hypothetical protein
VPLALLRPEDILRLMGRVHLFRRARHRLVPKAQRVATESSSPQAALKNLAGVHGVALIHASRQHEVPTGLTPIP